MAKIRLADFGGEMPSVSSRMLPPNAARTNKNLLATTHEFRPLKSDGAAATSAVSNPKTIYRMSRDSSGAFNTNMATGWVANSAVINYVKGQIDDDLTERTYYSFNDGVTPPRVVNAKGDDRQLGVPIPASITATLNQGSSFTREDGSAWATQTLVPAIVLAIKDSIIESPSAARMGPGSVPIAGPYTTHGLWWINEGDTDYWNLRYSIDLATGIAAGLNDPSITPETVATASTLLIRISCLPFWGYIADSAPIKTKLKAILNPRTNTQLMSDALVDALTANAVDRFNPNNTTISSRRSTLDALVIEFKQTLEFVTTASVAKPTAPAKPDATIPEYYWPPNSGLAVRSPEWVAYDTAVSTYNTALAAYNANTTKIATEKATRVAKIADLQAQALAITQYIEAEWAVRKTGLEAWITDWVASRNYEFSDTAGSTANDVTIDTDRVIKTFYYEATYVTDRGEESAPCLVSNRIDGDQYSSITVTIPTAPAGRHVTKWRLYRSAVSAQSADFLFVQEFPIGTLTYTDTKYDSDLGEPNPTMTWVEPPSKLQGLVGVANGIMAGFFDNVVCFCEPYEPYAWPTEYQLTTKYPIVGLGSFGQSLFVGTRGAPYIASGSDSASMSLQELPGNQACVSQRSIVSVENGVLYASPDGICLADYNGVTVVTLALFSHEDWTALKPDSIIASAHDGVYYFFYNNGTTSGCYALDFLAGKLVEVDLAATALFSDKITDTLYAVSGTAITAVVKGSGRRTGLYRTGIMKFDQQTPMAWLQVDSDFSSNVTVRWYGDGVLRHTAVVTSITPVRLPAGTYLEHEVEIETTARVTSVNLYSSTAELRAG